MVEIFTVGGGEYIVNVLNAVAAWTGAGGYKSLIQVALVMGMALAVIVLAFNQDWRAWLNWFLGATLIYMCLMVPRMDVHVTDRVNPGLAPATVANVPLGLALMASFTSQAGDPVSTPRPVSCTSRPASSRTAISGDSELITLAGDGAGREPGQGSAGLLAPTFSSPQGTRVTRSAGLRPRPAVDRDPPTGPPRSRPGSTVRSAATRSPGPGRPG